MAEDEQEGSGAGKWLPPTDSDKDRQENTLPGVPGSFSGGPDVPGSSPAGAGDLSSGDPLAGLSSGDPLGGGGAPPPSSEPTGSTGLWSGGADPGQSPSQPQGGGWGPPPSQGQGGWAPPPGQQQTYPPYQQQGSVPTNGKATASLILGIVGIIICPLICSVLALIFGYQSRKAIDASHGREGGRGLATAGIVLGWIGIVLAIFWAILIAFGVLAGDLIEEDPDSIGRPSVILGLQVLAAVSRVAF